MIVDAHLHCSGKEAAADILEAMDGASIDVAILLAPFLDAPFSLSDRQSLRRANAHLAGIVKGHEDRLVGFAVVNPLHDEAADDLAEAADQGLRGLKLVPAGWYPYDDCAHHVYERCEALALPILFHSGIFIDGRSGRFCRPTFYEAVRDHPGLRVTLAHLGWPWTDEANAVGLIDLINGIAPEASQFRFDFSFGAPPVYRKVVLDRALAVLGPRLIQFGSDRFMPCTADELSRAVAEARALLAELHIPDEDQQHLMGGTAMAWLGIS